MLNKITGEVRVFANELEVSNGKAKETRVLYNCQIGARCINPNARKKEWLNCYVPVNFSDELKKEADSITNNSFDVVISEAWFTCYKDKDEKVRPVLFINKAKIVK